MGFGLNPQIKEHPRVCGENGPDRLFLNKFAGTSPRMRGKRGVEIHQVKGVRNIPAYAGKTGP